VVQATEAEFPDLTRTSWALGRSWTCKPGGLSAAAGRPMDRIP